MMVYTTRRLVVVLVAMASSVMAMVAAAQAPAESTRRNDTADVYVNDSFEAADLISKAQALAEKQRWGEAAALIQRLSGLDGDKVIRVAMGRYVGLRAHVNEVIARWPEAGVRAYRERADRLVQERLAVLSDSHSIPELLDVFERFFCTSAAAELADRIGQLAMEAGDFALAERVYRRVLDVHPDGASYSQRYRTMLHVLETMRGRKPSDPPAEILNSKIRLMGTERTGGDALGALETTFGDARDADFPGWPMQGGRSDRNRFGSANVDELGSLWQFDFVPSPSAGPVRSNDQPDPAAWAGATAMVNPILANGLVFAQMFRDVVALRESTGGLVWRYTPDPQDTSNREDWAERPVGWDVPTFRDGRLFVVLSTDADPYYGVDTATRAAAVVALDAQNGQLIWRADAKSLGEAQSDMAFDSSPLVDWGHLYVVGRRRRSFGFEDCYLYCLNASTGRVVFRSHLGSASTGTFGARQPTTSIPALRGDTVYVATNLGSIAAVDAYTGAVRWLQLYPREEATSQEGAGWSMRDTPSWAFNPVLISRDRVLCLPTDSSHVLVLDVADGQLQRTIPADQIGGMETLLGARDDVVCGTGRSVSCIDSRMGEPLWSIALGESETIAGRGCMTDELLLVPTSAGLARFSIQDGARKTIPWEAPGQAGHVVALADRLMIGGPGRVAAYVRRADRWTALLNRMAEAPDDPQPALELAEVSARTGELQASWDALQAAVERAERATSISPDTNRRIYETVVTVTEALTTRSSLEPARLERLVQLASVYSPDSRAHLAYRLRFAIALEATGKVNEALGLLQQILRDRSLRELDAESSGTMVRRGGDVAREKVEQILSRHGRELYASFEAEAKRWLESATAGRDVAAFQRLIDTFPNSESAGPAMVRGAELLRSTGRSDEAVKWLSRALHQYASLIDQPQVIRTIADIHERSNDLDRAYRWLSRGARQFPQARIVHDGAAMTLAEYRDRLVGERDKLEAPKPAITLPLTQAWELDLPEGGTLLSPRFPTLPVNRWNHVFVSTKSRLFAYSPQTGEPVWGEPVPVKLSAELAYEGHGVALFTTPFEVFMVDVSTGKRRWSFGEYPARVEDGRADWEDGQTIRSVAIENDRLVIARDNGQMHCLRVSTGEVVWSQAHRPAPSGGIKLMHPWVVYSVMQDGQSVICLVDAATGSWVDGVMTGDRRPVEEVFAPWDDQLVVLTAQSLGSFDLERRTWRWRVPLSGLVRKASVLLDLDALYLSDDGMHIRKYTLDDGKMEWETTKLGPRGMEDLTVDRVGGALIVSSSSSVTAIDSIDGRTLWDGTPPPRPRFTRRFVTAAYVGALDTEPGDPKDSVSKLYFYDHRNASGLIPKRGGMTSLGSLGDLRGVLPVDGSLVVQSGTKLRAWRGK